MTADELRWEAFCEVWWSIAIEAHLRVTAARLGVWLMPPGAQA